MSTLERVQPETDKQKRQLAKARQEDFEEVWIERPRMGGTLWMGGEEAAEEMQSLVDEAERNGRCAASSMLRSHRVNDDFSPRWSHARVDFERTLYSKRSKVQVSFVELKDTLPVHGPLSEYTDAICSGKISPPCWTATNAMSLSASEAEQQSSATSPRNSATPTTARFPKHCPGSEKRPLVF